MLTADQIAQRKLIADRVSPKTFAPKAIPDAVLADVLRLTQRAPTPFNTQPYVVVVARSEEDRARVANAMLPFNTAKVSGAALVAVFAADLEPSKEVPRIQKLMRANDLPDMAVEFMPKYLSDVSGEGKSEGSAAAWAHTQTSLAAMTFMYAAGAHGLVTRPMEGFDHEALKKAVGLSDRYSVPMVVSVGYPDETTAALPSLARFDPTEVFFEGKLGDSTAALFKN